MALNPQLFDAMASATSGHQSEYAKEGRYLYRLDTIEMKPDRFQVPMFVATCTCVHIFHVEPGVSGHRLGATVSILSKTNKNYFMRDVKKVLTAACGCTDAEVGKREAWEACGYNEHGQPTGVKPLDGKFITLEVNNVLKNKKDTPAGQESNPEWQYTITNFHGAKDPEFLERTLTPEAKSQFFTLSGQYVLAAALPPAVAPPAVAAPAVAPPAATPVAGVQFPGQPQA